MKRRISHSFILVYLKKNPALKKPREKTGLFEKTRVLLVFFKISGFLPTLGLADWVSGLAGRASGLAGWDSGLAS